jgi:maltase-glucoamylase
MWALGWHSSASAFKSLSDIESNIQSYNESSLPLEGIWLDVSYKAPSGEFLVDQGAFSNLTNFTKAIQADGKRMIITVDPTLDVLSRGPYYLQAQQHEALIKSTINRDKFNGALTAEVNKRQSVFLDFFNDKAIDIWKNGLKDLYSQVEFDGLWLDTNELKSQCEGECPGYKPKVLDELYDKHGLQPWYKRNFDQSLISSYNLPF